jgi:hypothetical protein
MPRRVGQNIVLRQDAAMHANRGNSAHSIASYFSHPPFSSEDHHRRVSASRVVHHAKAIGKACITMQLDDRGSLARPGITISHRHNASFLGEGSISAARIRGRPVLRVCFAPRSRDCRKWRRCPPPRVATGKVNRPVFLLMAEKRGTAVTNPSDGGRSQAPRSPFPQ